MNRTEPYSHEDIQRYLQHKMDAKEMHAFEIAMMNDPFLADAIEGYRNSNSFVAQNHIHDIKKQITTNNQPAKVVQLSSPKTTSWKVAAIVFIIVSGAAISYMLFKTPVTNKPSSSQVVETKPEEIPVAKDNIAVDKNTLQTEKALGDEAVARKRKISFKVRNNVKASPHTAGVAQSKQDTAALAMTGRMDERTLMTNNEMASNKTMMTQRSVNSPTASATAANQEFKEVTTDSNAQVKSEASAKRIPAEKGSNYINKTVVRAHTANRQRDVAGSIVTMQSKEKSAGEPQGGWDSFNNYVKREIESFRESTDSVYNKAVTLDFSIDEKGQPSDIQIIRDANKNIAGEAIIDKAIQILINGPRWIRNKDQSKVRVTIEF